MLEHFKGRDHVKRLIGSVRLDGAFVYGDSFRAADADFFVGKLGAENIPASLSCRFEEMTVSAADVEAPVEPPVPFDLPQELLVALYRDG